MPRATNADAKDDRPLDAHYKQKERETMTDPKPSEPSELARKIAVLARNHLNRIFMLEQGSDRLPQLISTAGLADLEARLEAAEQTINEWPGVVSMHAKCDRYRRERDEARGRLEKIALQHYERKALCAYCKERWPCLTYRQATEEGEGDG